MLYTGTEQATLVMAKALADAGIKVAAEEVPAPAIVFTATCPDGRTVEVTWPAKTIGPYALAGIANVFWQACGDDCTI